MSKKIEQQIIRPRDISSLTGLSPVTIYRLEKAGKFPSRIKLSPGAVGWRRSEIEAWLDARQAA